MTFKFITQIPALSCKTSNLLLTILILAPGRHVLHRRRKFCGFGLNFNTVLIMFMHTKESYRFSLSPSILVQFLPFQFIPWHNRNCHLQLLLLQHLCLKRKSEWKKTCEHKASRNGVLLLPPWAFPNLCGKRVGRYLYSSITFPFHTSVLPLVLKRSSPSSGWLPLLISPCTNAHLLDSCA